LALREGQVPPLVCPNLEGGTRLPLFQYYSGTSYWVPALWSLWDSNPYRALKVGVFLHVFAAGWAVYGVAVLIGGKEGVRGSGFGVQARSAESAISEPGPEISDSRFEIPDFKPEPGTLNPEPCFVSRAALVAATAFQLAPFSSADLYARGSYTEFCALHASPVVLYAALRLARARGWCGSVLWVCLCGLAVAYFVPLHPVQTMLCGALVALLVAVDVLPFSRPARGTLRPVGATLGKLAAAALLGVAGSAWFWWPVLRDYGALRIVPHGAFLDAGLSDPAVLLWPTYRRSATYPWGPQLGLHFAVAAVVAILWGRARRAAGVAAGVAVIAVVYVVLFQADLPAVQRALRPLQWSYRLLVPATLAGAVCAALALAAVLRRAGNGRAGGIVLGAAAAWVLVASIPYFLGNGAWLRESRVRNVVAPTWEAPNSTAYALRGTDYRRLDFVRADGMLNTNVNLVVPPEGVATLVEMELRRMPAPPGGSNAADSPAPGQSPEDGQHGGRYAWLEVRLGESEPAPGFKAYGESRLGITLVLTPRVGHVRGDGAVRFHAPEVAPGEAARWRVDDVTYRAVADEAGKECRLPERVVRRDRGTLVELEVDVAAGREGWYQLPVYTLPSNEVRVNDAVVEAMPSANRAMVMARLGTGKNVVKIRTLPARAAWGVSVVAVAGMMVGAGWYAATPHGLKIRATDDAVRDTGFQPVQSARGTAPPAV
jgi:hypothetical protein